MTPESVWRRVTRSAPCTVCARPTWCGRSDDGAVAICMRVPSEKVARNGGFVHPLDGDALRLTHARPLPPVRPKLAPNVVQGIAERAVEAITEQQLERLAVSLGVEVASLVALDVGWHRGGRGGAFSFPMRNSAGEVVGLRLRPVRGRKFALRGGVDGVFLASRARWRGVGPLVIAEGESDTAALLPHYDVVGRPSCRGAVSILTDLGRGRVCVIVADDDAHGAGQLGARALARALRPFAEDVVVTFPPQGGDAREWLIAGGRIATLDDLLRRRGRPSYRRGSLASEPGDGDAELRALRQYLEDDARLVAWEGMQS